MVSLVANVIDLLHMYSCSIVCKGREPESRFGDNSTAQHVIGHMTWVCHSIEYGHRVKELR